MCKPVFPLKAIFYYDDGSIEDIWVLNNFYDISCNIEEHDSNISDNSFKIFDATNKEVHLEMDQRHEVKVLRYKKE